MLKYFLIFHLSFAHTCFLTQPSMHLMIVNAIDEIVPIYEDMYQEMGHVPIDETVTEVNDKEFPIDNPCKETTKIEHEASVLHESGMTNETDSKINLSSLPDDMLLTICMNCFLPLEFVRKMSLINKCFNNLVNYLLVDNEGVPYLIDWLKKIDEQIIFDYHFSENPNGSSHRQCYKVFPCTGQSAIKLKNVIKCVSRISLMKSISVNECAQKYKLLRYIRFHDEFVFRAILPGTRSAWRSGLENFLHDTFFQYVTIDSKDKYVCKFDLNYQFSFDYSNKKHKKELIESICYRTDIKKIDQVITLVTNDDRDMIINNAIYNNNCGDVIHAKQMTDLSIKSLIKSASKQFWPQIEDKLI